MKKGNLENTDKKVIIILFFTLLVFDTVELTVFNYRPLLTRNRRNGSGRSQMRVFTISQRNYDQSDTGSKF